MVLVDRIWAAHPLSPGARCVLLAICRQMPLGATEALINRTTLARELECTPAQISKALTAGEGVGLCQVLRNGRVAFSPEPLPGFAPTPMPSQAVKAQEGPSAALCGLTGRQVKAEFARQWEAAYGPAGYAFLPGRDDKLAATLARTLTTTADLTSRVRAYLGQRQGYYADRNHPFQLFATRVNEFIPAAHERERAARLAARQ